MLADGALPIGGAAFSAAVALNLKLD